MLVNRIHGTPVTPFQALTSELDRMLEGALNTPFLSGADRRGPAVTIWEDDDKFTLEVLVPGFTAEGLDVSVHANRVTLKGERKEAKRENAHLHRQEWAAAQFERTFELPVDVDGNAVNAELRDGILTLSLPKSAGHKPQKIKIVSPS